MLKPLSGVVPPDFNDNEEFEKVPNGTYEVESLNVETVDDNKRPIVTAPEGKIPKLRVSLESPSSGHAIPMSLELGEVPLLVRAFKGDVNQLPSIPPLNNPSLISDYLDLAQSLANSGSTTKVTVRNGWGGLSKLFGALLPTGTYSLLLYDIGRGGKLPDGTPIVHKSTKYEDSFFFFATFLVLTDALGEECAYSGVLYTVYFNYGARNINGELDWLRVKKGKSAGEVTPTAINMANVMEATAPSFFNSTPSNIDNILGDWLKYVKSDSKPFSIAISITEDGQYNKFNVPTITPVDPRIAEKVETVKHKLLGGKPSTPTPTPTQSATPPTTEPTAPSSHMETLQQALNLVLPSFGYTGNTPAFPSLPLKIEKGSEVSTAFGAMIAPAREGLSTTKLTELTVDDVLLILQLIDYTEVDSEVRVQLANLSTGLQSSLVEEEDYF